MQIELAHARRAMGFDGSETDAKHQRDFPAPAALRDHSQDFTFAPGKMLSIVAAPQQFFGNGFLIVSVVLAQRIDCIDYLLV